MKKEIKYHTDPTGHCEVLAGKTVIARAYCGNEGYEVRILQGLPREETMQKIREDCPEFLTNNNIADNYSPKLFSTNKKKK
jgi:beta-lactam-binding protein with PASTA domain